MYKHEFFFARRHTPPLRWLKAGRDILRPHALCWGKATPLPDHASYERINSVGICVCERDSWRQSLSGTSDTYTRSLRKREQQRGCRLTTPALYGLSRLKSL